jgi:hypothetical protein
LIHNSIKAKYGIERKGKRKKKKKKKSRRDEVGKMKKMKNYYDYIVIEYMRLYIVGKLGICLLLKRWKLTRVMIRLTT